MNENAGGAKKAARLTGALLARKGMATPAGFVRMATEGPPRSGQAVGEAGESRAAPVLAVDGGQAKLALDEVGGAGKRAGGSELASDVGGAKVKGVDGDWASLSDINIGPRFREVTAAQLAGAAGEPTRAVDTGGEQSADAAQAATGPAAGAVRDDAERGLTAAPGAVPPAAANDRGLRGTTGASASERAEPALLSADATARATPEKGGESVTAKVDGADRAARRPAEGWAPARRISPELADPRPRRAATAMPTRPRRPRRRRRVLPAFVSMLALVVFLLVSWTVYQIGQGAGAAGQRDGGTAGLWSSAEELGFAVSQMFAAVTGRLDESPAPGDGQTAADAPSGFIAGQAPRPDNDAGPAVPDRAGETAVASVEANPARDGAGTPVATPGPVDDEVAAADGAVPEVGRSAEDRSAGLGGDIAGAIDGEAAGGISNGIAGDPIAGDAVAGDSTGDLGQAGGAELLSPGDVARALPSAADSRAIEDTAVEDTLGAASSVPQGLPREPETVADALDAPDALGAPGAVAGADAPEPDAGAGAEVAVAPASGPVEDDGVAGGPADRGPLETAALDQVAAVSTDVSGVPGAPETPGVPEVAGPSADAPGPLVGRPGPQAAVSSAGAPDLDGDAVSDGTAAVAPAVDADLPGAAGAVTGVPVPKPDVLARAGRGGAAADGSVAGYAVQLSSLRDEAAARREWARLREELADVLGGTELTVEAGSVSSRGTFYRVLTTRFDNLAEARAICEGIHDVGQDCLVVRQR